jgi:hypothetical protein
MLRSRLYHCANGSPHLGQAHARLPVAASRITRILCGAEPDGYRHPCRPARSRHLRDLSALFGLNAGIIDGTQFSLLITVVVGSALIPTAIAQTFFHPIADLERRGRPVAAEEYV